MRGPDGIAVVRPPVRTTPPTTSSTSAAQPQSATAASTTVSSDSSTVATVSPRIAELEYGPVPFSVSPTSYTGSIDGWYVAQMAWKRSLALETLTPEQRAQFEQVQQVLYEAGDTEGLMALERLLLHPDQPLAQGDLLNSLARLATEPKAKGMVEKLGEDGLNARLVSEVLRQIENPESIAQSHGVDTCGEASMEQFMAETDPEGYARLMADLTSNTVEAHWGGERIFASTVGFESLGDQRSLVSNLFQHSWHTTYSNPNHQDGLAAARYGQQIETLNPDFDFITVAPENAGAAVRALEPGAVVLMALDGAPAHETHAVVFEGYDPVTGDVLLRDPLSGPVAMTRADFEKNIRGAALPDGHSIPDANLELQVGYGDGAPLQGAIERRRR